MGSFRPVMSPAGTYEVDWDGVGEGISIPVRMLPNIYVKRIDMTDEELFLTTPECFYNLAEFQDVKDQIPKLRSYLVQLDASEGFDLDENPTFGMPSEGIRKVPCCAETHPDEYKKYEDIARFVIDDYNRNNGTMFVVTKVESMNARYNATATFYFITFTALQDSEKKIFQAKVHETGYHIKAAVKTIELCRIKA